MAYIPTTEDVEERYAIDADYEDLDRAAFQKWLTAHDNEVAAKAMKTWANRVRSELDNATLFESLSSLRLEALHSILRQAETSAARTFNDLYLNYETELIAQAFRNFAQSQYLDYLDDPDLPAYRQPEGLARIYAYAADNLMQHADQLTRRCNEQ